MEQQEFQNHLVIATKRALSLAREMVSNHLPDKFRYRIILNASYDGNPLTPQEQVFLKDAADRRSVPVSGEEVVAMLWRNDKVPEWIDIYVKSVREHSTVLELLCCGRFTASNDHLYHKPEGHPPFHVQSPRLPPRWNKENPKFDLMWSAKKLSDQLTPIYPDVVEHGSLAQLLNVKLAKSGSDLRVRGFEEDGRSSAWARIQKDRRSVELCLALNERVFTADYWDRGVKLATFMSDDVTTVALSLHAWCVTRSLISQLPLDARQLKFDSGHLAAFEAGPKSFVQHRWLNLLKAISDDPHNDRLDPVIRAASENPQLRTLWPYFSMMRLGFSRCTGYPFSGDCPIIVPILQSKHFQVLNGTGAVAGQGSANEAIALAVQNLPPDCGPAIHGTADDLFEKRT